jgi:TPR repeat protein
MRSKRAAENKKSFGAPMKKALATLIIPLMLTISTKTVAGPVEDAVDAFKRGDYATALSLSRPFAEQGNAIAQFDMGLMYDRGLGVAQD